MRYEYDSVQASVSSLRVEAEKSLAEKEDLEFKAKNLYETEYFLNVQIHRQSVVNQRLHELCDRLLAKYPDAGLKKELKDSQDISIADIRNRITHGMFAYSPFAVELYLDDGRPKASPADAKGRPTHFRLLFQHEAPSPVSAVAISSSKRRVFSCHRGAIDFFNLDDGKFLRTDSNVFDRHHIRAALLNEDSSRIYVCGEALAIYGWDIEKKTRAWTVWASVHQYTLLWMNQNVLLGSLRPGSVCAWDIRMKASGPDDYTPFVSMWTNKWEPPARISSIQLTEDGNGLMASDAGGFVRMYDVRKGLSHPKDWQGNNMAIYERHLGAAVNSISRRQGWVIAGKANGTIDRLYEKDLRVEQTIDLQSAVLSVRHLRTPPGQVPKGQVPFITCCQNGIVRVWGGNQTMQLGDAVLCSDATENVIACGLWNHKLNVFVDYDL